MSLRDELERFERAASLVAKRARDYKETGNYDVTLSTGERVKIYRDPETGGWFLVASPAVALRLGINRTFAIGYTKREALQRLERR